MSFHFAYLRDYRVYLAADGKIYDCDVLAPKLIKNDRVTVSFVGNLRAGRNYAECALAQSVDYFSESFRTEIPRSGAPVSSRNMDRWGRSINGS